MESNENSFPNNGEKRKRLRLGNGEEDNNGSSRNNNDEGEDRLSSLPDVSLVEILSLLPIQSAAATSVLSRRWRHLWTQVTNLDFSLYDFPMWRSSGCADDFYNSLTTIDRIFNRLTSPVIRSFQLCIPSFPAKFHSVFFRYYVQSWIRRICGRNAEELAVNIGRQRGDEPLIPLPHCVFETQSLKVLEVCDGFSLNLPLNQITAISLFNLKKLSIHVYDWDRELMGKLFKSCPLLEDLDLTMKLYEDEHLVDISARHLKYILIYMEGNSERSQFVIDAPELEGLVVYNSCLSYHRFVNKPSGLVDAYIRAHMSDEATFLNQMSDLVRVISGVKSFRVNASVFDSFKDLKDGVLPIFHNLTVFETDLFEPNGLKDLVSFLHYCPNLEVLVLPNDYDDNYNIDEVEEISWCSLLQTPSCLLNTLKRIQIAQFKGTTDESKFLKFVLGNANVLDRLVVGFSDCDGGKLWTEYDEDELSEEEFVESKLCKELRFCKKLFSHPRSSSTCEIEFSGDYLRASSKNFKNGSLGCDIQFPSKV